MFGRYYFPLSDNIYGFVEAGAGGGTVAASASVAGGNGIAAAYYQLNAGPGVNFFINEYVALEALLLYSYSNQSFTTDIELPSTTNPGTFDNFGTRDVSVSGTNIGLSVGFQVYFQAVVTGVRDGGDGNMNRGGGSFGN